MDTKEYVKQYQNDDLCQKWDNNIPCRELEQGYELSLIDTDVKSLSEDFPFLPADDLTGMIYKMGDGDYSEVYVTEWSAPYSLEAIYHPLSYYLED